MHTTKHYFHSYDALRFFAYLKVFLFHLPESPKFKLYSFIKSGGGLGVAFFFVLSGFLITHLLVSERIHSQVINSKRFMMRRILRIWPLFYFGVLLSFIGSKFVTLLGIDQGLGYKPNYILSLLFLENYKMLYENNFPDGAPLSVFWSLCVEEHFYLIWLFVFSFVPIKRIPYLLVSLFLLSPFFRLIYLIFMPNQQIIFIDLPTNIAYFALGGLLGFYMAKKPEKTEKLSQSIPKYWKILFIILIVICVTWLPNIKFSHENEIILSMIWAVLFTFLLFLFLPKNSSVKISDNSILTRWGRISYGMYVFHTVIILLCTKILKNTDDFGTLLLIAVLSFWGTIFIANLSYRYLEKPFLDLKKHMDKDFEATKH